MERTKKESSPFPSQELPCSGSTGVISASLRKHPEECYCSKLSSSRPMSGYTGCNSALDT